MKSGFMYGKLNAKKEVIEATREDFGKVMGDPSERIVAQDSYDGGWFLSTVFLGLNHGFFGGDQWFETMLFNPNGDAEEQDRYATWKEAEAGHKKRAAELEFEIGKPRRAPTVQELTRYGFRKLVVE